jgi:peptide/nickel transport system substrate-binding protein
VASIEQGTTEHSVVVTYTQVYADWPATFARGPWRATSASDPTQPAIPRQPTSPPSGQPEGGAETDPAPPPSTQFSPTADITVPTESWDSLAGKEGYFSGPYRYASWDGTVLRLVPNNLWWGEPTLLDSIELHLVGPTDLSLAYDRSEVDSFWVSDPNVYARVSGLAGISLRTDTGPTSRWLVANLTSGALANPLVYRAVLAGLDRYTIAASDLAGLGGQSSNLDNPIFRPFQTGYVNFAAEPSRWSIADAAKALDQAGYVMGDDGIRLLGGVPLTLRFLVPQGDSLTENEGYSMRAQLRVLGIAVLLDYAETANSVDLSAGGYDLTGITLYDRSPMASALRFAAPNPWGYNNVDVTTALRIAASDLNAATRRTQLEAVASTEWRYGPLIPLYEMPEIFFTRPNLANLGPDGLGTTRWEDVGWVR